MTDKFKDFEKVLRKLKKRNVNTGYRREREILKMISQKLKPVPGSGSQKSLGSQDGESEELLVQVKSTGSNQVTLKWFDLHNLDSSTIPGQMPLFALDFVTPHFGSSQLPSDIWVCLRLIDFRYFALPPIEGRERDASE